MSERADKAREALLELAAQLVAVSTSTDGTLADRMSDRFPWMLALRPGDQDACATAVLAAAKASFATHQPCLATAELTAWRETATAIAACLGKKPVEWLDEAESDVRPSHVVKESKIAPSRTSMVWSYFDYRDRRPAPFKNDKIVRGRAEIS